MTSNKQRLYKLNDVLTAKERALLVLRAWKDGTDEDPHWRWSMPAEQGPEFDRLIGLVDGINVRLVPLLLIVALEVDKLALRLGWLSTVALWYVQAANLEGEFRYRTGEVPLETPLQPPRLPVFHVCEDLKELVASTEIAPSKVDELVTLYRDALRGGLVEQSRVLRAAEICVGEVQEELGGEDPALADVRALMEDTRCRLDDVFRGAQKFMAPVELEEPDDDLLRRTRALASGEREAVRSV